MAYLEGFGLENFRVFKEKTWLDFAPITLLVGPNSSGKSSLIKALLLLKDNYAKRFVPVDYYGWMMGYNKLLTFGNKGHNLLNEKSIIPCDISERELSFTLPYNGIPIPVGNSYPLFFDISYKIKNGELFPGTVTRLRSETEDLFVSIPGSGHENGYGYLNMKLLSEIVNVNYENFKNSNTSKRGRNVSGLKTVDTKGSVVRFPLLENLKIKLSDVRLEKIEALVDNTIWPKNSELIFELLEKNNFKNSYELASLISTLLKIDSLSPAFNEWSQLVYLPSTKGIPKRYVRFDDDSEVLNRLFLHLKNSRDEENEIVDRFVKKWEKIFGFKESINWQKDNELGFTKIQIGDKYLSDMGFGISQLTAVLLANFAFEPANDQPYLLLLEEPEANLHPAFQSKLADMFADSERTLGHQFIIETHSEYMIRKFQYLVAKGEMKPEDVVIYYFNDPDETKREKGAPQVKKITVLEDGSLSDDFGPGFYDEAAHWELELLKLKRSKTRQN